MILEVWLLVEQPPVEFDSLSRIAGALAIAEFTVATRFRRRAPTMKRDAPRKRWR